MPHESESWQQGDSREATDKPVKPLNFDLDQHKVLRDLFRENSDEFNEDCCSSSVESGGGLKSRGSSFEIEESLDNLPDLSENVLELLVAALAATGTNKTNNNNGDICNSAG